MILTALPHNLGIRKTAKSRSSKGSRPRARAPHEPQPTDLRLGHIVRLLMEHATVVVSGTKIAQEISSSRSEVWRLIQQLRGLGVDVAGHPATGYRLRSVPDLLLPEDAPEAVAAYPPQRCKGKVIHHGPRLGVGRFPVSGEEISPFGSNPL